MSALSKLLPVAALAGGGAANKDDIQKHIDKVVNYTKTVSCQYELNNIAKFIYIEVASGGAKPKASEFSEFLRKNQRTNLGVDRDPAIDFWGTKYVLIYNKDLFYVYSAGPDAEFKTEDDLYAGYQF